MYKRSRSARFIHMSRAKNVASDELGLRVPVDNRCIAFASEKDTRIVAVGTGLGRLRLYDTR